MAQAIGLWLGLEPLEPGRTAWALLPIWTQVLADGDRPPDQEALADPGLCKLHDLSKIRPVFFFYYRIIYQKFAQMSRFGSLDHEDAPPSLPYSGSGSGSPMGSAQLELSWRGLFTMGLTGTASKPSQGRSNGRTRTGRCSGGSSQAVWDSGGRMTGMRSCTCAR